MDAVDLLILKKRKKQLVRLLKSKNFKISLLTLLISKNYLDSINFDEIEVEAIVDLLKNEKLEFFIESLKELPEFNKFRSILEEDLESTWKTFQEEIKKFWKERFKKSKKLPFKVIKDELYFYVENYLKDKETNKEINLNDFLVILKENTELKKYLIIGKSKIGKTLFVKNFMNLWSESKIFSDRNEIFLYYDRKEFGLNFFVDNLIKQNQLPEAYDRFFWEKLIDEKNPNIYIFFDNIKEKDFEQSAEAINFIKVFNNFKSVILSRDEFTNSNLLIYDKKFELECLNDKSMEELFIKHKIESTTFDKCMQKNEKIKSFLNSPLLANVYFDCLNRNESFLTIDNRKVFVQLLLKIKVDQGTPRNKEYKEFEFENYFQKYYKNFIKEEDCNDDIIKRIQDKFGGFIYFEQKRIKYYHPIIEEFFIYKYFEGVLSKKSTQLTENLQKELLDEKLSTEPRLHRIFRFLSLKNTNLVEKLVGDCVKLKERFCNIPSSLNWYLCNEWDYESNIELEQINLSDYFISILIIKYAKHLEKLSLIDCEFDKLYLFKQLKEHCKNLKELIIKDKDYDKYNFKHHYECGLNDLIFLLQNLKDRRLDFNFNNYKFFLQIETENEIGDGSGPDKKYLRMQHYDIDDKNETQSIDTKSRRCDIEYSLIYKDEVNISSIRYFGVNCNKFLNNGFIHFLKNLDFLYELQIRNVKFDEPVANEFFQFCKDKNHKDFIVNLFNCDFLQITQNLIDDISEFVTQSKIDSKEKQLNSISFFNNGSNKLSFLLNRRSILLHNTTNLEKKSSKELDETLKIILKGFSEEKIIIQPFPSVLDTFTPGYTEKYFLEGINKLYEDITLDDEIDKSESEILLQYMTKRENPKRFLMEKYNINSHLQQLQKILENSSESLENIKISSVFLEENSCLLIGNQLYKMKNLKSLQMENLLIIDYGFSRICFGLKHLSNSLISLQLSHCILDRNNSKLFTLNLKNLKNLKSLHLSGNIGLEKHFDDIFQKNFMSESSTNSNLEIIFPNCNFSKENIAHFFTFLKEKRNIKILNISSNKNFENGFNKLYSILILSKNTLKSVNFSYLNLSDSGWKDIMKLFTQCTEIEEIDLSGNSMHSEIPELLFSSFFGFVEKLKVL